MYSYCSLMYRVQQGWRIRVLGVREHPLVTKSTLSNLKKSFMKHVVILRSNTNMIT